jgi:hypothetical protein
MAAIIYLFLRPTYPLDCGAVGTMARLTVTSQATLLRERSNITGWRIVL